jgi:ammonium transporter Rh
VRRIQEEELRVTNQFSAALHALQSKSHEKRRTREEIAREVYQKEIGKIRDKRRRYREMLYDAHQERKKLIDSMQIQKDEEDILRRKLAKLNALSAADTSREQRSTARFDKFAALFMVLQILLIVVFLVNVDHADVEAPSDVPMGNATVFQSANELAPAAPRFQFSTDIALFVVAGFGMLGTFLRKYQYSAVALTLLVTAFAFQWTIVAAKFFIQAHAGEFSTFILTDEDLLIGFYGASVCVITYGALVGLLSAFQLLLVALFEVIIYTLNIYIAKLLFVYSNEEGQDTWSTFGFGGDATHIHIFGAYFGLALGAVLGRRVKESGKGFDDKAPSYTSDVFAMIGTIFLWVLWPSFNAGLAPSGSQHRVIANTVLSLCSSVVFAFLGSRVFRGGKFDMIDIQNATLAGGVAIGSVAALLLSPGSAMIVGAVAAIFSTIGYSYLTPVLAKWGLSDTRGIHNLHGIPGIIGGIAGIVSIAIAYDADSGSSPSVYGQELRDFFGEDGSDAAAWYLLSLLITLALASASGGLLGFIMSFFTKPNKNLYQDDSQFVVPGDFEILDEGAPQA